MTFFSDALWAAADAAGMHVGCTFLQPGSGVPKTVTVNWAEPDVVNQIRGTQSKRYEIEYRHADMPDLKEGDPLSIHEPDGVTTDYRVREAPYVDEQHGADGTYRCAVLTREVGRDS